MRLIVVMAAVAATLSADPMARRVVSTAPSITEILFALGAGDRVVGVSSYCHYPREATTRTHIGSVLKPDLEAITALRPDLVVINRNPNQLANRLQQLGLRVVEVDPRGIEGIYRTVREISEAIGSPEAGASLNDSIRNQLEDVRRRAAQLPRRRVTFIVGRTPDRIEGLVAVGKDSYLGEVLAIAGGTNVFADAPVMYPRVPVEEVLSRNPEVVIDMGDMAHTTGVTEEHKKLIVSLWNQFPVLAAVREHQVYAVASDIFVVPGPRVVDAAREFFRLIHPEAARP